MRLEEGEAGREQATVAEFVSAHKGTPAEALTDLCHSLLNLTEFLYVD